MDEADRLGEGVQQAYTQARQRQQALYEALQAEVNGLLKRYEDYRAPSIP